MQIVQVFRFVYDDVIYIFGMLKVQVLWAKRNSGELCCPATALIAYAKSKFSRIMNYNVKFGVV